ncbi:unnamed protein product, partial [Didymodactylos carnosus]
KPANVRSSQQINSNLEEIPNIPSQSVGNDVVTVTAGTKKLLWIFSSSLLVLLVCISVGVPIGVIFSTKSGTTAATTSNLTASNVTASNVTASTVTASNVTASTVTASNVTPDPCVCEYSF